MALLSKNFTIWLRGLVSAAISAFCTAASGALTLPSVFNFSHDGLMNIVKLSAAPTLLVVLAYLKQSPLWTPDAASTNSPENGQVK